MSVGANLRVFYTNDGGEANIKTITVQADGEALVDVYGNDQPGIWQATTYTFSDAEDLLVTSNGLTAATSGPGYWGFNYAYVI